MEVYIRSFKLNLNICSVGYDLSLNWYLMMNTLKDLSPRVSCPAPRQALSL